MPLGVGMQCQDGACVSLQQFMMNFSRCCRRVKDGLRKERAGRATAPTSIKSADGNSLAVGIQNIKVDVDLFAD